MVELDYHGALDQLADLGHDKALDHDQEKESYRF
jgi:hypothetical protein